MVGTEPNEGPASTNVVIFLDEIERAYDAGKYLEAYELARALGPMESWPGAEGLWLAARLAENLGAPRSARRLRLRAFRRYPGDPIAWHCLVRTVAELRGPLVAWLRFQRLPKAAPADSRTWADLFALRAHLAAQMRDFEAADRWLAEAELLTPGSPAVAVKRAAVLELEGCPADALGVLQNALSRHPQHRPAVQATARLLQLHGRKSEALELLSFASAQFESSAVLVQLGLLQMESGSFMAADESFKRCVALCPLAEPETTHWLTARRADIASFAERHTRTARLAHKLEEPFYKEMAARLDGLKRILLPVNFARQHFLSGASTTLSALCAFWHKPAEHLEMAETTGCDGTSAHNERRWAEAHGWVTREFRVTWESAVALIDRGVPFTLTTREATLVQTQAVVGYDGLRGTLLVQDSLQPEVREFPTAPKLKQNEASGPRGLAIVPDDKPDLLRGVALPETEPYNRLHEMFLALDRHDRPQAAKSFGELQQIAPGHRLTLDGRRLLARYDGDTTKMRAATEALLALYPDDVRLQLDRLAQLRSHSTRAERLKLLRELTHKSNAHPLFLVELAGELSGDARDDEAVSRVLRRAAHSIDLSGRSARLLGNILWRKREFARAHELYRCAAGLDEEDGALARTYFAAGRCLHRSEEVMDFLADRFRRSSAQSSHPAITLFWAHEQLNQMSAAFLTLEAAMERRPDDADLWLFATEAYARYGDLSRAHVLLEGAKAQSPPKAWTRMRARLAQMEGKLLQALELWQEVVEREPTALDANAAVVELLTQTDSPGAGQRHLRLVCARFPHHLGLHEMWVNSLRQESARETEPVIQRALAINPANAWAHRELALNLSAQGDAKAALEAAHEAVRLEPNCTTGQTVLAKVLADNGRTQEGQAAARDAIRLSVGNRDAVALLVLLAPTLDEKKAVLAFIEAELIRQHDHHEGLLAFRDLARSVLEPEEVLAALKRMHAARPDLWHAWSAVILQMLVLERLDEAMPLAAEATEHFPLCSMLWVHRSLVLRARRDDAGELEGLERALEVDPANSAAADQLASAFERNGDLVRARRVLEAVCVRAAFNPQTHLHLATVLWKLDQRDDAIEHFRRFIEVEPRYDAAWVALREWAVVLDKPRLPIQLLRELTEKRPGATTAWLMLAQMMADLGDTEGALEAVGRTIRLQPRLTEACELKSRLHVSLKDKQSATEACFAKAWDGRVPVELRARAAWVEAELGTLNLAIQSMKEVLADHPGYYPGWSMLADWSARGEDFDGALQAASQLISLAPGNALPLGTRAGLKLRRKDRAGAKEDLQRALKLDPAYEYAAATLFDLLMEEKEFGPAAELLLHIQKYFTGYLPSACEARLRGEHAREPGVGALRGEARGEEMQKALHAFRELCCSKLEDTHPLESAFQAFQHSRSVAEADALVEDLVKSPGASPQLGAFWVRRRLARKGIGLRNELNALLERGEIGRIAIIAYIGELAARSMADPLRYLIEDHKGWLAQHPEGWEAVAAALGRLNLQKEFFEWTGDWRARAAIGPDLRLSLVRVLRNQGRDEEADEVARGIKTDSSHNPATHCLRVWVAVEAALAGETERGQSALGGMDPTLLDDYHRQVRRFARSLLEVQCSPPEGVAEAGKLAVQRMHRAAEAAKLRTADKAMRHIFRRTVQRLARDCGRPALRFWGWSQLGVSS